MVDRTQTFRLMVNADTTPLKRELAAASELGRTFASGFGKTFADVAVKGRGFARDLTKSFTDIAVKGRDLKDVFRDLALSVSKRALSAAIAPVTQAVTRGLPGPFGTAAGQILSRLIKGGLGFAHGAALRRGLPVPFAQGGVIAAPTAFPLAGGRLGVAGEAGPEAILPLARGSDGRLGVRAAGGGQPVAITFNVTSPDAESFMRSESQIAAMLNRAVSRGQRNL